MNKLLCVSSMCCVLLLGAKLADAAVTTSVSGDVLVIVGDAENDSIVVSCVAAYVKVNNLDPLTGVTACTALASINISGGEGADTINLSAVLRSAFISTLVSSIDGGGGDDIVTGSPFNDVIVGGLGYDTLYGGLGDDDITGNEGNDIANGNEGNDTMRAFTDGSKDHMDGGSGSDTLIVSGSADANDVIVEREVPNPTTHDHISITASNLFVRCGESEKFVFNLGDGDDRITLPLFTIQATEIHGEGGSNTIVFDDQCAIGSLSAVSYTQAGRQSSTFDNIASATTSNVFSITPNVLNVPGDASTQTLTLHSGDACGWSVSSSEPWITVDKTTGTGLAELTVQIAANTANAPRSANLMINALTVTVNQGAKGQAAPAATPASSGNAGPAGSSGDPAAGGDVNTTKKGCHSLGYGATPSVLLAFVLLAALRIRRRI